MIKERLTKRLYLYSLLFFAALLPFQFKWLPITLGMMFFSLLWLLTLHFGAKLKYIAANKMSGLMFAYFLWIVLGAFYSDRPEAAAGDIILKVPFAVWPVLLGSLTLFTVKDRQLVLSTFIYALAVAIVYSFLESFFFFAQTGDSSYLYFSKLVSFKMVPPHYCGMYCNFAYALVLLSILNREENIGSKTLKYVLLILFGVAVIFISSRMQYLVFAAMNFFVIGYYNPFQKIRQKVLLLVGIPVVLLVLAMSFSGSRSRLNDALNEFLSLKEMVNNKQTNPRKYLWREGWKVVEKNFWFGTGTGSADAALNNELEDVDAKFWDGKHHYYLRDHEYNYHNAYLQHWAGHGLVGVLILLALLAVPFFARTSLAAGKAFLLVAAISFLTESMLERQAGVLFFTFFFVIFFVLKPADHSPQVNLSKL